MRLPACGRDLARFHQHLEVPQVLAHLLLRIEAQQCRQRRTEDPTRHAIDDLEAYLRAAAIRQLLELDASGLLAFRSRHRTPGDSMPVPVFRDLRVPFDWCATRPAHHPTRVRAREAG